MFRAYDIKKSAVRTRLDGLFTRLRIWMRILAMARRRLEGTSGMNAGLGDPPSDRLAYSVEEAARITELSRDLLYDQMRQGKLAYLKVGRHRVITRQHLEAFLGKAS